MGDNPYFQLKICYLFDITCRIFSHKICKYYSSTIFSCVLFGIQHHISTALDPTATISKQMLNPKKRCQTNRKPICKWPKKRHKNKAKPILIWPQKDTKQMLSSSVNTLPQIHRTNAKPICKWPKNKHQINARPIFIWPKKRQPKILD